MRVLTPEQIKVLEQNDWVIVCESPFEMEFNSQFCGHSICRSTEDAYELYLDIIKSKESSKRMKEYWKQEKIKESERHVIKLKETVKDLLTIGITEETLLNFLNSGKDCMDYHGDTYIAEHYMEFFKEVFDEVDPP